MAKKYNLGSKSDMRKFERDLEKSMIDIAKDYAKKGNFDIECPDCGEKISVPVGESQCPKCGKIINLCFEY